MPRLSQSHTSRLWRRVKEQRPLPTARGPRGCTVVSSTACASLCAQPSALQRRHAGVSLPSVRRLHQTRVHRVLHASSSAPKAAAGVGQQPRSLDNPPRPLASIHHALSQPPSRGATSIGSTALDGSDAPLDGATQLSGGRRPHHFVNRGAPRDERRHALE